MTTIKKVAADKLNSRTQWRMEEYGEDYKTAWRETCAANPGWVKEYAYGDANPVKQYETSPARKRLNELQADPQTARQLASAAVDRLVREKLTNVSPAPADPIVAYKAAILEVRRELPLLSACEESVVGQNTG